MKFGLHAPMSGATDTFFALAERIKVGAVLWMESHEGANAVRLPNTLHVYRVPNPQPGEATHDWADRIATKVNSFATAAIPPGALVFQIGNEPDTTGYDLQTPWGIDGWFANHEQYRAAFASRWPGFGLLSAPLTSGNTPKITGDYVRDYQGIAVHAYWSEGNPGWRQGLDGGATWKNAIVFNKPIFITEINSNPTSGAELAAWEGETDRGLVSAAMWFVADSPASFPEYNVTMIDAEHYLANLLPPTPVPKPPVPNEPVTDITTLLDAINKVADDDHMFNAMLMGAALETSLQNVAQYGGGPGRGYWQIEAGPGGSHSGQISEADAFDPYQAANFMAADYRFGCTQVDWANSSQPLSYAYAYAAFRSERPAAMYPIDRVNNAWGLIHPYLRTGGTVGPAKQEFDIILPFDRSISILQGSDGDFSHGGKSAGFYAIDFATPIGTPIRTAASGRVRIIYWQDSNPLSLRTGHSVYIEHDNGYATFSCHMTDTTVAIGDRVEQGQIIGTTGDPASQPNNGFGDGPHCHWEIWQPSYFNGGVRVKLEDLMARGVAGYWDESIPIQEVDMKVETTFDDGILQRQWRGPSAAAVFKKIGGYDGTRGIDQAWAAELKAGRPLGFAVSNEEADKTSGRVVRYFSNGRITYFTADGSIKIN